MTIQLLPFLDVWMPTLQSLANYTTKCCAGDITNCIFDNFRNALVAVSEDFAYSTPTGWPKIRHTNISKWFWLIQHTMLSVAIQRSTGSARLSWNIVKCVVLHQPARVHVASERDTDIHKRSVDPVVLPGNARTVCIYAESDRGCAIFTRMSSVYFHIMYAMQVCIVWK